VQGSPFHKVNPGLIAQHDLICREAALLSRALLAAKQAFICSARANFAGILHATPSLRWSLLNYGGVALGQRTFSLEPC
jgi:hypothetical protein